MFIPTKNLKGVLSKLKETGFVHIFGSSVINQIAGFLSGIILIRVISKVEYGVYTYTSNIASFFLLLSGLGMVSAVLQICSEKNNETYTLDIYKYGFRTGMFINLLLSMVVFLFSVTVPLPMKGANRLLSLMSIFPLFILFFEFIQVYFRYNKYNKEYSYFSSLNTILVLICSVLGAVLWSTSGLIIFRYIGYAISIMIGALLIKFPILEVIKKSKIEKAFKQDLLQLGLISMANNASAHLIYILDIFILGLIIPDESVIASYKVATMIPNALFFIPNSLMIYLYPYFAQHNADKVWVKGKYLLVTQYFGIFNLLISSILILFAPIIIKIVFGAQYLDAVTPFRILSLGYLISATFRKIVGNLLVTQRKLKFNFWLGLLEGLLNIIGNLLLIPYLGSIGAAVSSLMVVTASSIIGVIYFRKIVF